MTHDKNRPILIGDNFGGFLIWDGAEWIVRPHMGGEFLAAGGQLAKATRPTTALADAIRREWLGGESPTGPGCSRPAAGGSP